MLVLKGTPTLEAKATLPAAELSKAFTGLELRYLAQINGTAVEMAYYSGGYDPTLPRLDFAVEDTIGTSQLCCVTGMRTTSHFQGKFFYIQQGRTMRLFVWETVEVALITWWLKG
jgi:hypothetical protein